LYTPLLHVDGTREAVFACPLPPVRKWPFIGCEAAAMPVSPLNTIVAAEQVNGASCRELQQIEDHVSLNGGT